MTWRNLYYISIDSRILYLLHPSWRSVTGYLENLFLMPCHKNESWISISIFVLHKSHLLRRNLWGTYHVFNRSFLQLCACHSWWFLLWLMRKEYSFLTVQVSFCPYPLSSFLPLLFFKHRSHRTNAPWKTWLLERAVHGQTMNTTTTRTRTMPHNCVVLW